VAATLQTAPKNATHSSTRQVAVRPGMSQTAMFHLWHAFALALRRSRTFRQSTPSFLVHKLRDIVGSYFNPP